MRELIAQPLLDAWSRAGDAGSAAAALFTLLAALSIVVAIQSLKSSERAARFDVFTAILSLLEPYRSARHLVERRLAAGASADDFKRLCRKDRETLDDLARAYDQVGLLVKHGTVPLEFLLDFYSRPLVVAWNRLGNHLMRERRRRRQPGHMKKFETLAWLANGHRRKSHSGEETLIVDCCELEDWPDAWKK